MKTSLAIRGLSRLAYYEFHVGDIVMYGKYKNKKGRIKAFKKDEKGHDVAVVEPIPKGRKQDKEIQVYRFWPAPKEATAADTVKVRRKDTGRVVEVFKDTLKEKGGEYEPLKEDEGGGKDTQETGGGTEVDEGDAASAKKVMDSIEYPEGHRRDPEPDRTPENEKEWKAEHTAQTPGGSTMIGTPHADGNPEEIEDDDGAYVRDYVVPEAIKAAEKAIKAGKKVVFISEGQERYGDYVDEYSDDPWNEQSAVAFALHKKFGDKVEHSPWDGGTDADLDNLDAPVWDKLTEAAGGDRNKAQAATSVFLMGQGDSPEDLRERGILTKDAEKAIKEQLGKELPKEGDLSDEDREAFNALAFPGDYDKGPNEISAIGDVYNAYRQDVLRQMISDTEDEGKVAIVTPGASHAWELKPVLEGKGKKASSSIRALSASMRMRTACIIAVGDWGGSRVLFKNRDRNYVPEIRLYHEMIDGTEVLYMKDELTGWCEGMNEYGIGIVNTALAVGLDEKEKDIAKGDKGAHPTKNTLNDGERVLKGLACSDLDCARDAVMTHKEGLKGHTFISDADSTYSLEATWQGHDYHVRKLPSGRKHVRTNHGQFHPDAGYTEKDGDSYLSSLARRDQAMKTLRTVEAPKDIAPAIYGKRRKTLDDPLNMLKLTEGMRTTSQLVLDLTNLVARLYLIPKQVKYLGYERNLPDGYDPKISVMVYEYTDIDGDGDFDVIRRKKVAARLSARIRAAGGKYKNKKEVPKADGKGTTTVYEYSENHLKEREKGKAKKINRLQTQIDKITAKAKKDLKNDDPKVRLPALAVLLINDTYERVGNRESSEENGHHGVTTWKKKHLKIKGNTATLSYTGKSGVKHSKKVTDPALVSELRTQAFEKSPEDYLFVDDDAGIDASDVNSYLEEFDITAKDIRGYHANRLVQEKLKKLTAPTDDDPKLQEKARKEQFKEVLELAAEEVGHEPSTLRTQYLAPSLEKDWLEKGKVNKSVSAMRTAAQSTLHDLLDNVMKWYNLLLLHRSTLDALIRAGDARRLGRIGQIKISDYDYTDDKVSADLTGSQGDTYNTRITFQPQRGHHCTCPDWQRNAKRLGPCKHVLALAEHTRNDRLNDYIHTLEGNLLDIENEMVKILEHSEL